MTLNIKNLEKLRDWLNDGAPHLVFNMKFGLVPANVIDAEEMVTSSAPEQLFRFTRHQEGIGDCGTVCCIAGAAAVLFDYEKRSAADLADQVLGWDTISHQAMWALGLPDVEDFFGHTLFNPLMAPDRCTPQQAALAVQNVIDGAGEKCWFGIA